MNKKSYELVFCVVNAGYSDQVMNAAREVGVTGGTVIHARGTANKEAEKFFKITIQPDKDLMLLVVPKEIKDSVLKAIYEKAGVKTEVQGIAFSVPVSKAVGLYEAPEKSKEEKAE